MLDHHPRPGDSALLPSAVNSCRLKLVVLRDDKDGGTGLSG